MDILSSTSSRRHEYHRLVCPGAWCVGLLTSGPGFKARTVSLCSHSRADAVKSTHRSGTFSFCASLTQTARVSGSAFVLSRYFDQHT
jgi:hypothetical protein